jgi:hypothetical protein
MCVACNIKHTQSANEFAIFFYIAVPINIIRELMLGCGARLLGRVPERTAPPKIVSRRSAPRAPLLLDQTVNAPVNCLLFNG